MVKVSCNALFGDGTPLKDFGKIIQSRMKYLDETARDSIAACAVTFLKSLRTVTRVAKVSSIKVSVKNDASLYPSFSTRGGHKILCVRHTGSKARYDGDERIVSAGKPEKMQSWGVFRWTDNGDGKLRNYIIVAPSQSAAKAKAKSIVRSRQIRYAGLAKRALGTLMHKVSTKQNPKDPVPQRVNVKASQETKVRETIAKANDNSGGGKYSLSLLDNLKYAGDAIKGGQQAVSIQLKKAMNKIVSIINHKMPDGRDFFGRKKLKTPFPEVTRRRK